MSDDRERTDAERPSSPVWALAKGMGTVFKQTFRRDNTDWNSLPEKIVIVFHPELLIMTSLKQGDILF